MPPHLECINHFYPKVIIEADPTYQPPEKPLQMKTNYSLQLLQHKEEPLQWQLQLSVTPESKLKTSLPYKIDIQAVGLFEIKMDSKANDLPDSKDMANMVLHYGGPMLYASVRELVLGITSRGPWGSFRLPTIALGDPNEEASKKTDKPAEKEKKQTQ